jgi:hypothetical protein
VTVVNTFRRLRCSAFPSPPQRMVVHAVLTDGLGDATISVVISRLDTLEEVSQHDWQVRFKDPLSAIRFIIRLPAVSFPIPASDQVSLLADGEWLAPYVLHVRRKGD